MTECDPETYPCWQHYGEHWDIQPPTKWVIGLALAVVRFRAATAKTDDEFFLLYMAAFRAHELINQRWRNINREPFQFMPHEEKDNTDTYIAPEESMKAREFLSQLGFSFQSGPKQHIARRL